MESKDVETGVFLPPNSVYVTTVGPGSGRRNADGLKIPDHETWFNVKVVVYKILLTLYSITLVLLAILILLSLVAAKEVKGTQADTQENQDKLDALYAFLVLMVPFLAIFLLVALVDNVIGWTGITTLRMKWLRLDFGIQCCLSVLLLLSLFSGSVQGISAVVWQVIQTLLLYFIMRDIRTANGV